MIADIVLLRPETIPPDVMHLQLARTDQHECGLGFAHAVLPLQKFFDERIHGTIVNHINAEGLRRFTRGDPAGFWFERGSSGSPVFLTDGQQLAGLISLSHSGKEIREAFVVPATTILEFVFRAQAKPAAEREKIDPALFDSILAQLGHDKTVPASEIPAKIEAAIAEMKARAEQAVPQSNAGNDIAETLNAARAKLGELDQGGALALIDAKLDDDEQKLNDLIQRRVSLLREKAAIKLIGYDYAAARQSLEELLRLDPDQFWDWIELGDIWETTGSLEEASKAFLQAQAAAQRSGDERDLSVSHNRIGKVQVEQGDLPAAIESFSASLTIGNLLAQNYPEIAELQRDLLVTYHSMGNVQEQQSDLPGALDSFSNSVAIGKRLAQADPGNGEYQRDLLVSYSSLGNVQMTQGKLHDATESFSISLDFAKLLAQKEPVNAECQQSFSILIERVGNVHLTLDKFKGALNCFFTSLDIITSLVQEDAENANWQADQAASYAKLADVHQTMNDTAKALEYLQQGQMMTTQLTRLSPTNAIWARNLAWFDARIAELGSKEG